MFDYAYVTTETTHTLEDLFMPRVPSCYLRPFVGGNLVIVGSIDPLDSIAFLDYIVYNANSSSLSFATQLRRARRVPRTFVESFFLLHTSREKDDVTGRGR